MFLIFLKKAEKRKRVACVIRYTVLAREWLIGQEAFISFSFFFKLKYNGALKSVYMSLPVHTSHPSPHGIQSRPLATWLGTYPEAHQKLPATSLVDDTFKEVKLSNSRGVGSLSAFLTHGDYHLQRTCWGPLSTQFTHLPWINIPEKEGGLGPLNKPLLADVTISLWFPRIMVCRRKMRTLPTRLLYYPQQGCPSPDHYRWFACGLCEQSSGADLGLPVHRWPWRNLSHCIEARQQHDQAQHGQQQVILLKAQLGLTGGELGL